jgi:hypothetical protein
MNFDQHVGILEAITYKGTYVEIDKNGEVDSSRIDIDDLENLSNLRCYVCDKKFGKENKQSHRLYLCSGCDQWFCIKHFTNEDDHKTYGEDGYFYCIRCDQDIQKEMKEIKKGEKEN